MDRWRENILSKIQTQKWKYDCHEIYTQDAQNVTSVPYQTVKKAMSSLIKVQYYKSKFL